VIYHLFIIYSYNIHDAIIIYYTYTKTDTDTSTIGSKKKIKRVTL
jgi:hypothetical protein